MQDSDGRLNPHPKPCLPSTTEGGGIKPRFPIETSLLWSQTVGGLSESCCLRFIRDKRKDQVFKQSSDLPHFVFLTFDGSISLVWLHTRTHTHTFHRHVCVLLTGTGGQKALKADLPVWLLSNCCFDSPYSCLFHPSDRHVLDCRKVFLGQASMEAAEAPTVPTHLRMCVGACINLLQVCSSLHHLTELLLDPFTPWILKMCRNRPCCSHWPELLA